MVRLLDGTLVLGGAAMRRHLTHFFMIVGAGFLAVDFASSPAAALGAMMAVGGFLYSRCEC